MVVEKGGKITSSPKPIIKVALNNDISKAAYEEVDWLTKSIIKLWSWILSS